MIWQRFFKPAVLLALAVGGVILAGCNENPVSAPGSGAETEPEFSQADAKRAILERYEALRESDDFIVGTHGTVLQMQAILERYDAEPGVEVKRRFNKTFTGFAIHVDSANVEALLDKVVDDPAVAWIEPDLKVKRPRARASALKYRGGQIVSWGAAASEAPRSSTRSGDGSGSVSGVHVFLLDTGVEHRDLNVVEEINFTESKNAGDHAEHGSLIASALAASDNNDGVVGIAPGVRVHNYKVLDDNGHAEFSTVIAALERIMAFKSARPNIPMVVNLSFGALVKTTEYNALDKAVAAAASQGIVVVAAAGNDGSDASLVTPAHVAEVITVGAYDKSGAYAKFSNSGSAVDLLAPGVDVEVLGRKRNAPALMTGTSIAVPHVSGAAALYLSRHPAATPQEVADALVDAASPTITNVPAGTTNRALNVASF